MSKWPTVKFGQMAADERASFSMGPFGSKITKENYVPLGIPVVRGVNLAAGSFVDSGFVFITDEKADELASANVVPGDLLFTHRGTIGQVSMIPRIPRHPRYVIGSSQVKARLDESVAIPEFYYYWFRSPHGQASILANISTVGVPGLATPLTTIRNLTVPCPPLVEQKAIAYILGSLDSKIEINNQISLKILELGTAIYDYASQSPDWFDVRLGDAADWHSGGTPSTTEPTFWNGEIPWISAASMKTPWIARSDRCVTELGASSGTRLVPKGTVIFVVRGMSLKSEFRIGVSQRTLAFGQDCKALVPTRGVCSEILFHGIRSKRAEVLGLVDEAGHGTGRLATDRIEQMLIRVPSLPNHPTVAVLRNLEELAVSLEEQSRRLVELRDTLLPSLVSGETGVREAQKVVEEAL